MTEPRWHGFVVARRATAGPCPQVHLTTAAGGTLAKAPGLRAWSRPFVNTPEGCGEIQPVASAHTCLWYQGFVADRRRLAARLGLPTAPSAGDGALLVAAFERWREGLVDHVLGEYAYVAVERTSGRLVAGHDGLALRGLLYTAAGDTLWVASNLELLLAALPARPELAPAELREFLASHGQAVGRGTVWRGIHRLEPGRVLVDGVAGRHELVGWRPAHLGLPTAPGEDLAFALRSAVADAVGDALHAAGNVWCDLSGGLDSSTVTALAAQRAAQSLAPGSELRAFSTLYPSTPKADERAYQQLFLSRYPLAQDVLDVDQHRDYTQLDAYRAEPTFATFRGALEAEVRRQARSRGVRVNLTGVGGDQVFVFGDFPPLYLHRMLREAPRAWARDVVSWLRSGRRNLWNLVTWCSVRRSPNSVARPIAVPPQDWAFTGLAELAAEIERDAWSGGSDHFDDVATELQYRMLRRIGTVLHSRNRPPLEYRQPLLDRRVVELTLALPWATKLRPGQDRVLQRQAFVNDVPAEILARRDKANMTFARFAGLRENWALVQPFTSGVRLAELGLVDPARFQAACVRMRHGLREHGWLFLAVALNLEAWLRQQDEVDPDAGAAGELRRALAAEPATLRAEPVPRRPLAPGEMAFLQRFETGRLPRWRYRHRGRLRVAWLYLRQHGPAAGVPRAAAALRAYDARCRRDCYHETLTRFWLERVRESMGTAPEGESFAEFLTRCPELTRFQHVYDYYRRTTLFSPAARESWVAPDLRPLLGVLPGRD